ncbi:MAG: trpC [Anaerocolumna sp.]|nr:trpC [Anaerocolumna sp.]
MILDNIVNSVKLRIEKDKEFIPLSKMKIMAESLSKDTGFPFENALKSKDISFICEVKKASPSKGIIDDDFPYLTIAKEYEDAMASCISVLTEPEYFKGSDRYLTEIRQVVSLPLLRKDFIIEPYQIYQSKVIGADCVLLICSLLENKKLEEYLELCNELGLSALVEAHDEEEVKRAVACKSRIIGVNNRDLKTFQVDINNSVRLRKLVPQSTLFIAESGIKNSQDIDVLRSANVNGVLIGETLMRADNKVETLKQLRGIF